MPTLDGESYGFARVLEEIRDRKDWTLRDVREAARVTLELIGNPAERARAEDYAEPS